MQLFRKWKNNSNIWKISRWVTFTSVWNRFSWTLTKFQFIQLIRTIVIFIFLSVVWLSWNFVRFHKILFHTDAESFSFLSWKAKKNIFRPLSISKQKKLCLLTQFSVMVLSTPCRLGQDISDYWHGSRRNWSHYLLTLMFIGFWNDNNLQIA